MMLSPQRKLWRRTGGLRVGREYKKLINIATLNGAGAATPKELACMFYASNLYNAKTEQDHILRLGLKQHAPQRIVCKNINDGY